MLARRLALAIGLLFGLIGAQGPEFSQQYRQRLGGALDELRRIVAAFDAEAASQSLTPSEGIARLKDNSDPLARERGDAVEADIAREARLEREIAEMHDAGPLRRLVVMAADLDAPTARQTLRDFEPAAPVTSESLIVGAITALLGWVATHLVAWPIRRARRSRERAA